MTSSKQMNKHHLRTLLSADQINDRIRELADEIRRDTEDKPLTILVVLKGAFIFAADIIRSLKIPLQVEFICVSSYGLDTCSSGDVKILLEPKSLAGRDVLVVDDICDTGYTLDRVKKRASELGASSVKTCVLLDKPSRREVQQEANYVGFVIPDVFVAGYGIDIAGEHRELEDVCVVEE